MHVMAGSAAGGAETAFVDCCKAMAADERFDVTAVTRANRLRVPQLKEAGVEVRTLPFGGWPDVYTPFALAREIRRFRPDIVQCWMSRAAQKMPPRRSGETFARAARLGGYYKMRHFKSCDYFIANTPDLLRHIEDGGIAASSAAFIPNFAHLETDHTPVQRADLDTPDDACVLLSLGRLHTAKAHDVAIKSLKAMPDDVYLWIAGEGPQRGELEALVQSEGVEERVRFLGWRSDAPALLEAADICLFVSRTEPFGNVFVQSWAAKTPLIVSDAEGPRQFCRDGADCLMVPREDQGAIGEAVAKLRGDKVLAMKLINEGYNRYLAEFTKERTLALYADFYARILAESGRRSA